MSAIAVQPATVTALLILFFFLVSFIWGFRILASAIKRNVVLILFLLLAVLVYGLIIVTFFAMD